MKEISITAHISAQLSLARTMKMNSQLERSMGMSIYVDPDIARIAKNVCAKGHLASRVVRDQLPRHSDS